MNRENFFRKYDKIIEVGSVKVRNGEIIDRFQQLVCPGIALPEKITGLTGITQEELLEAKGSETVIPQLLDFLEDDVILGHSVMFDYSFLKKAAVNQNLWRPEQSHLGLDTLRLSRIYLPELPDPIPLPFPAWNTARRAQPEQPGKQI